MFGLVNSQVTALGFVVGRNTYLHDAWNVLDAVVVVSSWLPFFMPGFANSGAIRAFRLLRPLRSISRFRTLKRLVTSIIFAIPSLVNLMLMLAFLFFAFGVVGLQLWSGKWRQRCHIETCDERAYNHVVAHASTGNGTEAGHAAPKCVPSFLYAHDQSAFCAMSSGSPQGSCLVRLSAHPRTVGARASADVLLPVCNCRSVAMSANYTQRTRSTMLQALTRLARRA